MKLNLSKCCLLSAFFFLIILAISCKKDNTSYSETITKGEKWGIQIGSSPSNVYTQLQRAGAEKGFYDVAIIYRKSYSKPEEVQNLLPYYQAVTLQSNDGRIERVILNFGNDKITSINAGGALPAEVIKWPQNTPDEIAIHKDDLVSNLYPKLLAIFRLPKYISYQVILPDKPLSKPFDPDMAGYNKWAFTFSSDIGSSVTGRSFVKLLFKNGKLNAINHTHDEQVVVNQWKKEQVW